MPKISIARLKLMTAQERSEISSMAVARIPRSWRTKLQRSKKSVTEIVLRALAAELRRLQAEQEKRKPKKKAA